MITAIIVGSHLAVAVADRPPVLNLEQTCREETTNNVRTSGKFEVCVADEKRARDELAAQWSSFDPAARTRCARESTSSRTASYLELLVCLELDQADREVRESDSITGMAIPEPGRTIGKRDEATDSNQSQPVPSRPAPAAAPSKPAPVPRSVEQPIARSAAAPPAAPSPTEPPSTPPSSPVSAAQPPSQNELLQQSFCRSPLGSVLPGCR